jgi:hypothetical protein
MIRHQATVLVEAATVDDPTGGVDVDVWQDDPGDPEETVTVALGKHSVVLSGPRDVLVDWLNSLAWEVADAKPTP